MSLGFKRLTIFLCFINLSSSSLVLILHIWFSLWAQIYVQLLCFLIIRNMMHTFLSFSALSKTLSTPSPSYSAYDSQGKAHFLVFIFHINTTVKKIFLAGPPLLKWARKEFIFFHRGPNQLSAVLHICGKFLMSSWVKFTKQTKWSVGNTLWCPQTLRGVVCSHHVLLKNNLCAVNISLFSHQHFNHPFS